MPAPLFPYTWQYNNQPIEVLAQTVLDIITNGVTPAPVNSPNYIPVSNGLTFEDSIINTKDIGNNDVLETLWPTYGSKGFLLQPATNRYTFGECDPNALGTAAKMVVDNFYGYAGFEISGSNSYSMGVDYDGAYINVNTAITAGAPSGSFLTIKVNGIAYKLQLLTV